MSPPDPVELLCRLVRQPSPDPPGREIEVARIVEAELQALGIATEFDEFLPGRANVIGRVPGRGERPAMVFSAHLDTVPAGAQPWSFDPFAGDVVGGRVRGRGTSDMKSAVAAFIAAAAHLQRRPMPLAGDVVLAFTAGESSNCLGARRLVERGFQREIGAFLCGEPSGLDIITVEKAILWVDAVATGRVGHVSGAAGVNAIDLIVGFLNNLKGLKLDLPDHPLLSLPTVNVGRIEGGSAVNVTPDHCRAEIDIRFGPGIAVETVLDQVRPLVPEGVRLEVSDFKPAVEEPPDSPFVGVCAAAIRGVTGQAPEIKGVSYYSDGAILMDGIDAPFAIVGSGDLGASGQPDETCSVERLHQAVDIYVKIAENWLA